MPNLYDALSNFDDSLTQKVAEYSGLLGQTPNSPSPEVSSRNGYVYVRFRDNQNEIIQAYNETVSPVTNLPVVIIRRGTGWYVKGRDTERYSDWGSSSSFLPAHHYQHEFNPDAPGGDIVFVYSDAFVSLLVTPSGTNGGPNVIVQPYTFRKSDGTFGRVGGTGTQSLIPFKPADNQARMVVVYLNRDTGNHGILVNSGTSFAGNITGTSAILPYLPTIPSSSYEPLYGVRLVSGTSAIQWSNLYDLRQFYGGSSSGSGGGISEAPIDGKVYGRKNAGWTEVSGTSGGTTPPGGADTNVQINKSNAFYGDNHFTYDYANQILKVGETDSLPSSNRNEIHVLSSGTSPGILLWSARSNSSVAPYIAGLRANGSLSSPQTVDQFDEIFRIRARGYDGSGWSVTQGLLLFDAPYVWSASSHPTDVSVWGTPSGSTTLEIYGKFNPNGLNLPAGKAYDVNNKAEAGAGGWLPSRNNWQYHSSDDPSYVAYVDANVTGTIGVGHKIQLTQSSTDKFFIVTDISISGSSSFLNLYGGTDFDLSSSPISSPRYSRDKAPFGFPLSPAKWTVTFTDNTNAQQASPTANVWYNLHSKDIPIGLWWLSWEAAHYSTGNGSQYLTLSTANNSESDSRFTSSPLGLGIDPGIIIAPGKKVNEVSLSSKTTYYLNTKTGNSGMTSIGTAGTVELTQIKAQCAYL